MLQVIRYSDKAIAVTGDTRAAKDKLKSMGGRFNAKLTCGPGWIFKADRLPELEALISGAAVMPADTRTTEAPKRANDLPEWYVTPAQAKADGIGLFDGDFFWRLSDGGLVEFIKPRIETHFCFGYGIGCTLMEARDATADDGEA